MSYMDPKIRTAADTHKCSSCRGVIVPGELYERQMQDAGHGRVSVRKTCSRCLGLVTAPCDMRAGAPYDFAWCLTHDTTFLLGGLCPKYLPPVTTGTVS